MPRAVQIVLDKPRHLRFDLEALEDLERVTGQPLGAVVNSLHSVGVTTLKWTLWAGLKHEDKALTPNLVRKLLQDYVNANRPLADLTEGVNEAIITSGLFPSETEGNGQPEAATTT